jgi:hypothetical protein
MERKIISSVQRSVEHLKLSAQVNITYDLGRCLSVMSLLFPLEWLEELG